MSYESLTRDVHAILFFYNEKSELVDISRAVSSITVKQITCSEDRLKMGEFCTNCLEFEYYQEFVDENIAWNNKRVKLSFVEGKTEEERSENKVDVGIFFVSQSDVETSNNGLSYKVTAYDLPSVMSEEFDTTKTSTKVSDIVSYICKLSGLSLASGTSFSLTQIGDTIEDGLTNIGMLAYIAGYDGKNIRMNANGEIETYWYYSNSDKTHFKGTVGRDSQLLNEFTNKPVVSSLNAITSGYSLGTEDDGTVISVGDGIALTYTNPYVTKAKLEAILKTVKGFDYSTGSVKFRGNPNYRCGDTVRVETTEGEYVLFPIMEQTITYDGGMVSTIESYTYETENTVMGSMSQTDKKISQVYTGLTQSFQKQTGLINENLKGGYYRLLQDAETKYPYGWMITNSEEVTATTKGWRFTQGGLQYSDNGFKTSSKIAITMDGQISADMITTGTLKAINIEGVTIKGATISGNTITGGTISGATISGNTITGGTISGATISGNTITGGTISGATISGNTITGGTISGATISGNTITGGTISGATISGSTIKFGTDKTMTLSGDANNLYMHGNASFILRSVGQFFFNNYKDTSYANLQNRIFTSSQTGGLVLENYSKNTNVLANWLYLEEDNTYNYCTLVNRAKDTDKGANVFRLTAAADFQEAFIYNEIPDTSKVVNRLMMHRDDDYSYIELLNKSSDGYGIINNLYMWYKMSGGQGIGMYQRNGAGAEVAGNINITNNEAQIGRGDACYLHFNADGYIYAKTGNSGAYKVGWKTVNGSLVLGAV